MDECKNRDPRPLDLDGVGKMTQREKFEALIKSHCFYVKLSADGSYYTNSVEMAWAAWQESAKHREEEIARLRKVSAELLDLFLNTPRIIVVDEKRIVTEIRTELNKEAS